tara:strand:- start:99 stop:734 length:636 start_codon:yes stop_codon:yes gene_type:complete
MSVGIKTNPNYQCVASTPDGQILLGEVNEDNVTSGITLRVGKTSSPVPHYIQMDKDGDALTKGRKGTICRSPGAFQVKAGDMCGDGIPGVYIDSGNGDLVLRSDGRIRILAENIDLIASGSDEKNGIIQINSNSKVLVGSDDVHIDSGNLTKIFSDKTTEVIGNSILNLFGSSIEQLDATAGFKGSTGFLPAPWTPREMREAINSLRRIVS